MSRLIAPSLAGCVNNSVICVPKPAVRRHLVSAVHFHGAGRGHPASTAASQSGVGLIEVLVAVLVLSIAFLGIAALQAVSLSTSNSAMARSMATIASYSILDAMRADSANAKAGKYNQTGMSTSSCPTAVDTLANLQISQWCTQLGNSLGKSATTVGVINCAASGNCTVTVQFDDSRSGAGGSSSQQVNTVAYL